eukprot:Gregarina_sp_Poly_1__6426@NODE_3433_length_1099_cov_268_813953_g236_i2_p1_GENE_NODE_3433_length_1099_cov_268_813953_g236_i2NODE_3433_length_1099_cov_268_813953_g236_i2_p1_ORF_typecomplete_len306_score25_87Thioredoxin_8/PF13905_6/3_9e27PUB/PF09409_10/1_2e15AhpCTSA/PF00578_21/1_3e08Thioredoxin/PF00085_20/2_8e07Thioredoxin/PF00085_20/3_5e03Redoxin/PF08534_10/9_1e08Thioredoxin_2/PF13098_6/1_7e05Thioredoxin_9/PF14595_6/0_00027Thioredoxin_9/PF14595_6/2_6e03TraF/PF13728_6/0_00038DnaGprimase_HBD/PF16730
MSSPGPNDVPFPNPNASLRSTSFGQTETQPFHSLSSGPGLSQVLGDRLHADISTHIDLSQIHAEVIAIYFSAHWCPPCRQFTPLLANLYNHALQLNKSFDIVFGTNDRSAVEFQQYYSQMPWKAIPYMDKVRVQTLMTIYGIRGIPSLVIVDKHGNTLQSANVVAQIRRSSEIFLARLPNNTAASLPQPLAGAPVPPQDPSIVHLTVDDVLEEFQENQTLTNEQRFQGLSTLKKLLDNIEKEPQNPKFRTIKKDNKQISEKVLKFAVFTKMLKLAGFRETQTTFVAPLSLPLPRAFKVLRHLVEI